MGAEQHSHRAELAAEGALAQQLHHELLLHWAHLQMPVHTSSGYLYPPTQRPTHVARHQLSGLMNKIGTAGEASLQRSTALSQSARTCSEA